MFKGGSELLLIGGGGAFLVEDLAEVVVDGGDLATLESSVVFVVLRLADHDGVLVVALHPVPSIVRLLVLHLSCAALVQSHQVAALAAIQDNGFAEWLEVEFGDVSALDVVLQFDSLLADPHLVLQ